jgi:hypothetical protein
MKFKRGDKVKVTASVGDLVSIGIPKQLAEKIRKDKYVIVRLNPAGPEGKVWIVIDNYNLSLKEEFVKEYEEDSMPKLRAITIILSVLLTISVIFLSYYVVKYKSIESHSKTILK